MTIDQIKQCIRYAEGFVIDFNMDGVQSLCSYSARGGVFSCFLSECVNYPTYSLFLQRVLEGINRSCTWFITDNLDSYFVRKHGDFEHEYEHFGYEDNSKSQDQAKEAAIVWVLEHEA